MKKILISLLLITNFNLLAQDCDILYKKKFSKEEAVEDINHIYNSIQNAHINPYSVVSEEKFSNQIIKIKKSIPDSLTQKQFYKYIKPVFQLLNDEHAGIMDYCLPENIKKEFKVIPTTFYEKDGFVLVKDNFGNENISVNSKLLAVNHKNIEDILNECSKEVFGVQEDRKSQLIDALWYYLPKYCNCHNDTTYILSFENSKDIIVEGISMNDFKSKRKSNKKSTLIELFYIDDFAYLKVNSFEVNQEYTFDYWNTKIDSIFSEIKKSKKRKLIIDISHNGGGHSKIGNILIDYIYNKPYTGYQGYWKKSKEYADLLKKFGVESKNYDNAEIGEIIEIEKTKYQPDKKKNRFKGTTYIVVGKGTFSSAMMMGTIVKDNNIAKLVGEKPIKGHPNHFGELYMSETPNTKLKFFFGVKEWIRPNGEKENNYLIPDINISLWNKTPEMIIRDIENQKN